MIHSVLVLGSHAMGTERRKGCGTCLAFLIRSWSRTIPPHPIRFFCSTCARVWARERKRCSGRSASTFCMSKPSWAQTHPPEREKEGASDVAHLRGKKTAWKEGGREWVGFAPGRSGGMKFHLSLFLPAVFTSSVVGEKRIKIRWLICPLVSLLLIRYSHEPHAVRGKAGGRKGGNVSKKGYGPDIIAESGSNRWGEI